MSLPISGQISFNNINVELKKAATSQISLNDAAVRDIKLNSGGQLDINSFFAKQYSAWYGGSVTAGTSSSYGGGRGPTYFYRGFSKYFGTGTFADIGTASFQQTAVIGGTSYYVESGQEFANGQPANFFVRLGLPTGTLPSVSLISTLIVVNVTQGWTESSSSLTQSATQQSVTGFGNGTVDYQQWFFIASGLNSVNNLDTLNIYFY